MTSTVRVNKSGHILTKCIVLFQAKLKERIEYEDLDSQSEASSSTSNGPALKLTNMDRYLHGPTPVTATQYHTSADILLACQAVTQEMMAWNPKLPQVGECSVEALFLCCSWCSNLWYYTFRVTINRLNVSSDGLSETRVILGVC